MLADFTNKFYREFQKRINSKAGLIQVNILYAKQTYMKCLIAPNEKQNQWTHQMMHSWLLKDSKQQEVQDKEALITGKNVFVVTNLMSTGQSLKSMTSTIVQFNPKSIQTVSAFRMQKMEEQEERKEGQPGNISFSSNQYEIVNYTGFILPLLRGNDDSFSSQ